MSAAGKTAESKDPKHETDLEGQRSSSPAAQDDVSIDEILSKIGTHRAQYLILIITTVCAGFFAMQTSMARVAKEPIQRKFPEARTYKIEFVEACAQLICQLLLLPLIDQFGRKKFLLIGTICSVLTNFVGTFAIGYMLFLIARGIQVFFSALLPTVSYMYTIESMASKKRTIITVLQECVKVIYVLYLFGLKRLIEVWAQGDAVWKWLSPLACVPALLPIGLMFFATESPRFLLSVSTNREKTSKALTKLCPGGEQGLRARLLPQRLSSKSNATDNDSKDVKDFIRIERVKEQKGPFKKVQMSYYNEWLILKNPLTYAIGVAWVFQTAALWGLTNYFSAFPNFLGLPETVTHIGTLCVQFVGQVILWIIMLVIGRVWAIRVFATIATTCHLIIGFLLLGGVTHPGALCPFTFIAFAVSPPLWGPLIAYSNERYATTLRSTALAILSAASSICAIGTAWFKEFEMTRKEKWIVPLVLAGLNVGVIAASKLWTFETATLQLKDEEDDEQKEDPDTVEEKKKRLQSLRNIKEKFRVNKLKNVFKKKPAEGEEKSPSAFSRMFGKKTKTTTAVDATGREVAPPQANENQPQSATAGVAQRLNPFAGRKPKEEQGDEEAEGGTQTAATTVQKHQETGRDLREGLMKLGPKGLGGRRGGRERAGEGAPQEDPLPSNIVDPKSLEHPQSPSVGK